MEVIINFILLAMVFFGVLAWAVIPPETEEQRLKREKDEYYHRYF